MDAPQPSLRKAYTLGRFEITRRPPGRRGNYFHVKAAYLVGLSLIVLHDGVYRQTQPNGDGDFEVWGTISHAGLDMLAMLAFITVTLILCEQGRIR